MLAPLLHLGTTSLGLAPTFYCLAGLVASAALFALVYRLPGEKEGYRGITPSQSRRQSEVEEGLQEKVHQQKEQVEVTSLWSTTLALLLASHFLFNLGIFAGFSFTSDRAVGRGLSHGESSLVLSVMGVANCLGRVAGGWMLDRFRRHAILLTVATMATNAVVLLASDLLPSLPGQAVYTGLFGLTFGAYISSVVVVLQQASPTPLAPSLGLTLLTVGLSSLAGPSLVGGLYDLTSSYTPGFLTVGGLGLGGALLPLFLLSKEKEEIS